MSKNHLSKRLEGRLTEEEVNRLKSFFVDYLIERNIYPTGLAVDQYITEDLVFKVGMVDPDWAGFKNLDGYYNKPIFKQVAQTLRNMCKSRGNATIRLMEQRS